jgi:hypothetical protein
MDKEEEVTFISIGTLIESNHGYVLEMKPSVHPNESIVICFLPHNKVHPFVVHTYNELKGYTFSGEYCYTISEAQQKFAKRLG